MEDKTSFHLLTPAGKHVCSLLGTAMNHTAALVFLSEMAGICLYQIKIACSLQQQGQILCLDCLAIVHIFLGAKVSNDSNLMFHRTYTIFLAGIGLWAYTGL